MEHRELDICLDTSVLIAYLKKRPPGNLAVKKALPQYHCYVTAITVYELLFGVARIQKEIGEQTLLGMMTVLPLSDQAARQAAYHHADLISRNQDIGIKDVLIAAICLEYEIPILTTNERHFSRVAGLNVITPEMFLTRYNHES